MTGRPVTESPRPQHGRGPSLTRTALMDNPYGLTLREARAEIRRLSACGWQLPEIRLRFARTRKDNDA